MARRNEFVGAVLELPIMHIASAFVRAPVADNKTFQLIAARIPYEDLLAMHRFVSAWFASADSIDAVSCADLEDTLPLIETAARILAAVITAHPEFNSAALFRLLGGIFRWNASFKPMFARQREMRRAVVADTVNPAGPFAMPSLAAV
jgi:hypothetical protein